MASWMHKIRLKLKYGSPVILVSGLPRSGTSMAMKMLDAGGLSVIQDGVREADEDNPKGYFEDERIKDLAEMEDKDWFRGLRGRVIKVVSSLLQYLPDDNFYKVVFVRRDLHEDTLDGDLVHVRGHVHVLGRSDLDVLDVEGVAHL